MASGPKRILIVDDDVSAMKTYRYLLERDGYEVVTVDTARGAMSELESKSLRFDLILSDLRMPGASGLELLAETQEKYPEVPFVLVTAFGTSAIAAASKRMGAADFIDKLPDCEDLGAIIRRNILPRSSPSPARTKPSWASHAAWRWTCVVAPLAQSDDDLPTLADWASEVGSAPSTIKVCCSNVGVRAKESLDLGRALRIVNKFAGKHCDWPRCLQVRSPHTLAHFLERARLGRRDVLPSVHVFLNSQTFIVDAELVNSLAAFLCQPIS